MRLRQRPAGERLTGDSRGKTQVILDSRARSGLAAGRDRLQHAHVQPLRGRIDRRAQPGRPRPDDHQIMNPRVVEQRIDAERFSDCGVAWIPEDLVAAADDDGNVLEPDMKSVEQRLHLGVALDLEVGVGVAIAGEKLPQPQRVGRMARPEKHHVGVFIGYQCNPTQDERAHEQLAQLRVGLHDLPQFVGVECGYGAALADANARQGNTAFQGTHLAAEVAGGQQVDRFPADRGVQENLETAGQYDEYVAGARSQLQQNLTRAGLDAPAVRLEPRHLRRCELREHLLAALFQDFVHHDPPLRSR